MLNFNITFQPSARIKHKYTAFYTEWLIYYEITKKDMTFVSKSPVF